MTTSYSKFSRDASPSKGCSLLPWPIPPEGVSVEVARWWHGPTENRDAWHVVYRVSITTEQEGSLTWYSLRADSVEEDYFTHKNHLRAFHGGDDVEIQGKRGRGKEPPQELVRA